MNDLKPEVTFDDFQKLDLRVATIVDAAEHPNADRLLKLQLDLGPLGGRQICAGIKQYYEPGTLIGRQIIIVANLAGRKIRGEESNGMLLAATHAETEGEGEEQQEKVVNVVLLEPGQSVPAGSTVG